MRRLGGELRLEKVDVLASWKVFEGKDVVGRVLKVRIPGAKDKEPFYLVQWPGGGPVGRIDGMGRAYRYEPFKEGLVLVGMDSLEEDVKTLLELSSVPKLQRESRGQARPASVRKAPEKKPAGKTPASDKERE